MSSSIKHFLLIYDRRRDQLVTRRDFGHDAAAAAKAYREAEQEAKDNADMDIVLVGSDSIETVQATHGNYFSGNARRTVERALEPVVY